MVDLQVVSSSGAQVKLAGADIEALRQTLRGLLLTPGDNRYNEVRQVWNGMIDRRPALIARCTGTADVIDAVNFARTHDLLVSVRGGGHNVAGSSVCDGGLMIDLSLMKGIHVDPKQRTARAQPGVTWGEFDRETQSFGLAAPGGVVSTTGIAGLTLGGGLGWLRNKHGLSCDNLISVDVVVASGELVHANANENSELFWGIRGGGGNFGIITSFEYQLHPVGPEVAMSAVIYALEDAHQVFSGWRDYVSQAPNAVSSNSYIWSVPVDEDFPQELWNRPVAMVVAMYAGDPAEGEDVLRPLRQLATPLLDMSSRILYVILQQMFDKPFPKAQRYYYFKSTDLACLDDEVIDAIVARGQSRPVPTILLAIWHYGSAIQQVDPQATAFRSRHTPYLFSVDAIWDDPAQSNEVIEWSRAQVKAMQPYSSGGSYVNFSGFGEEGEALVRATYGENYTRLVRLKNQYDPTNLFHMNQNIRPTSRPTAMAAG